MITAADLLPSLSQICPWDEKSRHWTANGLPCLLEHSGPVSRLTIINVNLTAAQAMASMACFVKWATTIVPGWDAKTWFMTAKDRPGEVYWLDKQYMVKMDVQQGMIMITITDKGPDNG